MFNLNTLSAQAAGAQYVYDPAGRLVQVIDSTGASARYNYDPAGNLLSINKTVASTLALTGFSPNGGPVGTTVTIYGSGFSSTPTSNTVKFNGPGATVVPATVTASTTNTLTVTVPSGAASGKISVQTSGGSVVSVNAFTVVAQPLLAPVISSFSPTSALAGTSVTLSGSNFQPAAADNQVSFNGTVATVTAASATSLTATVPTNATSGLIRVSTPFGTASSAQNFYVIPNGQTLSWKGQVALGSSQTITIKTANTSGLLVFNGTKGQKIEVVAQNSSLGNYTFNLLNPNGSTLAATGGSSPTSYFGPYLLPQTGTYSILISGTSTTGSVTLSVKTVTDVTAPITLDGTPLTLQSTLPGQSLVYTFSISGASSVSPQKVSFIFSNLSSGFYETLYAPSGIVVTSWSAGNGFVGPVSLIQSGVYRLVLSPSGGVPGAATVQAYNVPPDTTGPITIGGSAVTVTDSVPGQASSLTFTGTAGQRISLIYSNGSYTTGGYQWRMLNPDGSELQGWWGWGNGGGFAGPYTLPATGTYTINIVPNNGGTGSLTLLINNVPPDTTGPITIGGSAVTVTDSVPGQASSLTFTGAAGQRISLIYSNGSYTTGGYQWRMLNPDGSELQGWWGWGNGGGFAGPYTLPATGTYTINIVPNNGGTGSLTLLINNVPPDTTGPITIGGSAVTVTDSVPGQASSLTFTGTAGQRISLIYSNGSYTTGGYQWRMLNPDGSELQGWWGWGNGGGFAGPYTLPATGTYTINIVPNNGGTGSLTLLINNVPPDTTGPITIGGSAVTVTDSVPGQASSLTFTGTAGQRISLTTSNDTYNQCYSWQILNPDGSALQDWVGWCGGGTAGPYSLAQSSTYKIKIAPQNGGTGSLTLKLTSS